jgi:hypothetical protein
MPGGAQFTTACTTGQNAYVYSTADLSAGIPAYYPPAVNFPGSVAVDSGGTVAVGSFNNPAIINVYQPDGTLLNTFNLGSVPLAAVNALAWLDTASGPELAAFDQAPGGAVEVFAKPQASRATLQLATATVAYLGRAVTLHGNLLLSVGGTVPGATVTVTRTGPGGTVVLPPATVAAGGTFTVTNTPAATGSYTYTAVYAGSASVVTVSGKAAVTVKLIPAKIVLSGPASNALTKSLTIKGTLTLGVGGVMVGTKLPITRTGPGTAKKVFTVSTGKGGAFTLTDNPALLGKYTYAVTFAGNAVTGKASASHLVTEVRMTPALSLASDATSVTYKSAVHLTAHLGATYSNRTVSIYARQAGGRYPTLLTTGRVNSAGNLIASYTPTVNTTFSAVFAGDSRYAMRTVTRPVGVGAQVTMQLTGYYGTTTTNGQKYLLYHQSSQMNVAVTVTPNKHGECVDLEGQEFYQGSWYPTLTGSCITLNTSSQLVGYLTLGQSDLGYPYRIRADYISSTSTNVTTDSPWQYFMIEP